MPKFIFAIGSMDDFNSTAELRQVDQSNPDGLNVSFFELEALSLREAQLMGKAAAFDADWCADGTLSDCWKVDDDDAGEDYYVRAVSRYATECLELGGDPLYLAEELRELADELWGD
jgi:hypothetical protein